MTAEPSGLPFTPGSDYGRHMQRPGSASHEARFGVAWEGNRSYLLAVATGMLGRPSEAQDVVQEAFARLAAASIDEIDDPRGWLVVVTRRLCLNRLASAETRRSAPTPDLNEVGAGGVDPADRLTLDDEVRRALAVVIDRLSPAERTSFILHDIFGFPFDAVAQLVGRTSGACRQLARRARQPIKTGSLGTAGPMTAGQQRPETELAERFIAVCEGGDIRALIELLDPEVAGLAHVKGLPALPVVSGAEAVAHRVMLFFGPSAGVTLETLSLEQHGAVVARRGGKVVAAVRLDARRGRIVHMRAIAQPGFETH